MRYWHPQTEETVAAVAAWRPDEIVLLPLYPQFSTTTAGSSLKAWHDAAHRQRLTASAREVPPYPTEPGFIATLAGHIDEQLAEEGRPARLLLSAHVLPLKIVRKGDPYPAQIESTAAAVINALEHRPEDWRVCYQSRVGPLAWLGPSVDEEIRRAGQDKGGVVIAPISFVSENFATPVELDLYLPRLFVYHAEAPAGSNRAATFAIMERRLMRGIMMPALVMAYLFGIALLAKPGIVLVGADERSEG